MHGVKGSVGQAILQAQRLMAGQQWLAAVETLRPHLDAKPDNYGLNLHLGRAHAGLGDRAAATERLLAAMACGHSDPIGAFYELVRLDLSHYDFGRIGLLDEALALPGELHCTFPANSQKRDYYCQIRVLQALSALEQGDYDSSERHLKEAYDFSYIHDERSFAFDWAVDRLRSMGATESHPHLEYLRRIFLRIDMTDTIRYQDLLDGVDGPANVVEIGAMDGVRFDPLHRHLVEKQWNAVVVEPLADIFELLKKTYQGCGRVRCANVAIAEKTGPIGIFRVRRSVIEEGAPAWLLGISSVLKRPDLAYFEAAVSEETVRGLTFEDFVDEFDVRAIDILQIDTEGYDWRILRQVDLEKWKIGLIHVELLHVPPPDRVQAFEALHRAGYEYTYDGMNLTAMRGTPGSS